jgi:hypothetical protein
LPPPLLVPLLPVLLLPLLLLSLLLLSLLLQLLLLLLLPGSARGLARQKSPYLALFCVCVCKCACACQLTNVEHHAECWSSPKGTQSPPGLTLVLAAT